MVTPSETTETHTFVEKKQEGILVLMDRLGTKGIWKQHDPNVIINDWSIFIKLIRKHFVEELKKKYYDVKFTVFSDTILITVYGADKEESILDVGAALVWIMASSMGTGFHFRGCLSYGLIVESTNSIIGPAIDEAAEYHTLQQWIGLSAAPSVHNILERINPSRLKSKNKGSTYVQYDIPLKNSTEKNGWAINWPMHNSDISPEHDSKIFSSIEQYVEYKLETVTGIPHVFKWRNTLDFLRQFKQ